MGVLRNFVGIGPTFPVEIEPTTGVPLLKTGIPLTNSSIKMILGWNNSRILLGEFGSRYDELLEEPNDDILASLVRYFTIEAIETWDKRIEILDVTILEITGAELFLQVRYRITNSNLEGLFTWTFYRQIIY